VAEMDAMDAMFIIRKKYGNTFPKMLKSITELEDKISSLEEQLEGTSQMPSGFYQHVKNEEVYQITGEIPVKLSGMNSWVRCVKYKNREQQEFATDRKRLAEKFQKQEESNYEQ